MTVAFSGRPRIGCKGPRVKAGRTFNVAMIDEWTKVETMTPKDTKLTGEDGNLIGGIDQQIIGRVRAVASTNTTCYGVTTSFSRRRRKHPASGVPAGEAIPEGD